ATLHALLDKLTAVMADYLRLQIDAGAQAIQVFDSWAGILDQAAYREFALPSVKHLLAAVQQRGVPAIYFLNGAPHLIDMAAAERPDVLGVCWRESLASIAARIPDHIALQGNLDPHVLFADPEV